MKLTQKELNEVIKQTLKETTENTSETKEVNDFLEKSTKSMDDMVETLSKLLEQGEELLLSSRTKDQNNPVLLCIGSMKKLSLMTSSVLQKLKTGF